jgi:hypothetical protein
MKLWFELLRLQWRSFDRSVHIIGCALVTAVIMPSASPLLAAVVDDADPEAVATQLRRGLGLRQSGDFARARTTFERVLRLENLPPDLHEQVEVYANAAQAWLDGRPAVASGYAVASIGLYREKDTIAGPGEANDRFGGLRVGGQLNVPASPTLAINASLDYRFRRYDDRGRRDDSDLRWALGGSRALGDANLAVGTRGWISARGEGTKRNDAGVYADLRWARGDNDQLKFGVELRRRSYPEGRLRDRSRDIVQLNAAWTHAFADGRASFGLAAHGGREFATAGNPYGDSNFIGLSPTVDLTFGDAMSAYVFGWWQRGRYNRDLIVGEAGDIGITGRRLDDLFEVGAGVLWAFAPRWEIGPSLLYLRDESSIVGNNYNSTEISLTLRRDF